MPEIVYDPKGPAAYAGAGNALSALGEVMQGTGPAQYRAAGRLLEAVGTLMGAQAQTWSDTLDGASAASVAGGLIASVAAAYALPLSSILATASPAALILLAANPVAAAILSAAFAFALGTVAWENYGDSLLIHRISGLLRLSPALPRRQRAAGQSLHLLDPVRELR